MLTTENFARLYAYLRYHNKVVDQIDFAGKLEREGLTISKSYMSQLLSGKKPISGEIESAVNSVYRIDLANAIREIASRKTYPEPDDVPSRAKEESPLIQMVATLIKENREERQEFFTHLRESQATMRQTAEASLEAARSVKGIEQKLDARLSMIEERVQDDSTMIRAIQEVLVTRIAPMIPNTSGQEIGAAVGNAAIRIAAEDEKKKKGTRTAVNM